MDNPISYSNTTIPVHSLHARREFYDSYPSCQRDYVWKITLQQRLIDSILRGLPVPPITVFETADDLMGIRTWIVDGQQRLKTILRYVDGEFKTAKTFHNEPELKPMAASQSYSELSVADRNRIDHYPLQICKVQNVDVELIGTVYRRFQYQTPLTFAERLYSYDGQTKDLAIRLRDHVFWKNIFSGDSSRKQIFQAGVHIVLMEALDTFCNMTTPRLIEMLQKVSTTGKWEFTNEQISRRLSYANLLFDGADMASMTQIIPIYQSVMLLDEAGYEEAESQRGSLALWFMKLREQAALNQRNGLADTFALLTKVHVQREFWMNNFGIVCDMVGKKRDPKRFFSHVEKITAWTAQKGICARCGKPVRYKDAVAHHVEPHATYGATQTDNCTIMHPVCHTETHAIAKFDMQPLLVGNG